MAAEPLPGAAAGAPGVFAGLAVDAEREAVVVAVAAIDVAVLLDHAAVMVLHLVGIEEIDLLHVEASASLALSLRRAEPVP